MIGWRAGQGARQGGGHGKGQNMLRGRLVAEQGGPQDTEEVRNSVKGTGQGGAEGSG